MQIKFEWKFIWNYFYLFEIIYFENRAKFYDVFNFSLKIEIRQK